MESLVLCGRREAVRLLLESAGGGRSAYESRGERRSREGMRTAVALMRRSDPGRARRLAQHVRANKLRGCLPVVQEQVDGALDWLAAQLPFHPVVPQDLLGELRDMLEWDRELTRAPETWAAADMLVLWADQEAQEDESLDEDEEWTDGARARNLSPEEPGTVGRFTAIGISEGAAAYAENPAGNGDTGRAPPARWRTREKRRARPPIASPQKAAAMLEEASGKSVEELRSVLRRGRPSAAAREIRESLAEAVVRVKERRVMTDALASALGCDCATVWRLDQVGLELIARSGESMGERSAGLREAA
jgi:hypothetical protein